MCISNPVNECITHSSFILMLELMMKLLAVDSSNQPSKTLKDHNKYVTKVRFVVTVK